MKIIFSCGGTGGHINPAIAAAEEIKQKRPDAEILFVGAKNKMEERLVPKSGFPLKTITISGFQRETTVKNIFKNIATLSKLPLSFFEAKKIIKEFNPDAVVGFGGYASGPILTVASKMGIKTAIHEQNAYPGVTNKILSERSDAVMLTAPEAEKYLKCKNKPIITGLPVRAGILNTDREKSREKIGAGDKTVILSFGGSLGAKTINERMTYVISSLHEDDRFMFIHSYGKYGENTLNDLKNNGVDLEREKNVDVREYIYNMDECLASCDLAVCRAGAGTLAELEATGTASILIPSPNVSENHQYYNALRLADAGGAKIIEEKDLTDEALLNLVKELALDKEKLKTMGENAKKISVKNSEEIISGVILSLIEKN